jgi:hypothetical protein
MRTILLIIFLFFFTLPAFAATDDSRRVAVDSAKAEAAVLLEKGNATGLTWRIDEAWSLELNYQYSKNTSTSDLYDYKQHYVSTGIAWSF